MKFDYKTAVGRPQTGIGAEKRPEHGFDQAVNMPKTTITTTQTIHLPILTHIYI